MSQDEFNKDSLAEMALFHDLDDPEVQKIAEAMRSKRFPAGATLMSAEQPGEAVYFILKGTVKVHIEQQDGSNVVISILGSGDIVGEMSLLDNATRSASVITIEPSQILWMDRTTFNECLKTIPV